MTVLPLELRNRFMLGDVRAQLELLPAESVHCVVTSPPYWGLRDYGADGQLGLEATPEEFVANLVDVFREVRRVLRKDGTVWLNLGDCYAGSGKGFNADGSSGAGAKQATSRGTVEFDPERAKAVRHSFRRDRIDVGDLHHKGDGTLKPKDLVGQPWRVAFALQADGWWLRSDIIWSKPNSMPESVTDRPTKSHEYLFLLAKSERYYYDADAIKEPYSPSTIQRVNQPTFDKQTGGPKDYAITGEGIHSTRHALENLKQNMTRGAQVKGGDRFTGFNERWDAAEQSGDIPSAGRNRRTVWEIPTQPYAEAHFATYPEALVLPCIQAGTSELGCCAECGAPWRRVVEREPLTEETKAAFEAGRQRNSDETGRLDGYAAYKPHQERAVLSETWTGTCTHHQPAAGKVPCVVLDPFIGSGTTALVALRAGRDFVGIELNEEYARLAERRVMPYRGRLL